MQTTLGVPLSPCPHPHALWPPSGYLSLFTNPPFPFLPLTTLTYSHSTFPYPRLTTCSPSLLHTPYSHLHPHTPASIPIPPPSSLPPFNTQLPSDLPSVTTYFHPHSPPTSSNDRFSFTRPPSRPSPLLTTTPLPPLPLKWIPPPHAASCLHLPLLGRN